MRDKLIDILCAFDGLGKSCGFKTADCKPCEELADFLISHGVTFADDNNVGGKPMTNGDRIRAMTDEELADCIADLVVKKIRWDLSETGHELVAAQISEIKRIWACSLREWLKQPAEEK